ncbi:MAG: DUF2284 domain-containing protein [Hornefia butyriciproducens]|uniref:DUF2284 domain-containing protein n=1 Tax=Hornefia butyriciproducens TaxID=2652293 RepID=UPI002A748ECB|nr:DUF2284 domain-containing protein [Hornefia butyriciproducens]MCI7327651.1 DUF2284 domain-containing protein [Clostridiales bacterium]MDY2990734.1 DUF2284 domain-containing protein [Hornefia butyriciproducens]
MNYSLERFEKETDIVSYIDGYVNVEEFLPRCMECGSYGRVWSCPPFQFDPMELWRSYRRILIQGYRLSFGEDRTKETMTEALWKVKEQLSEELFVQEREFPGSLALSAGSCQLCEGCTRPEGVPCRNKERMRHSIESLGGDVGKTLSELCGIQLEWVRGDRLPSHFVLCGALLKK